jgi:fatty acid desaturase
MRQSIIDALRAKEEALRQDLAKAQTAVASTRTAIPPARRTRILLFLAGGTGTTAGALAWLLGAPPLVFLPGAALLGAYAILRLRG